MSLPLPSSLTPSKVASFKDCALAFRYSVIDKLPEPPSPAALKGTLVHLVLERLFAEYSNGDRDIATALQLLEREFPSFVEDAEFQELGYDQAATESFFTDATTLINNYFRIEDPNSVHAIGTELMVEMRSNNMMLRGIIDRLDLDVNGQLIVVDYKTGRAPGVNFEYTKQGGVNFYALLLENVLGQRPASVKLLYLREPIMISTTPSEQSVRGTRVRADAVWSAVEKACETGNFRPNPGKVCSYCAFHQYCPAQGGVMPSLKQVQDRSA